MPSLQPDLPGEPDFSGAETQGRVDFATTASSTDWRSKPLVSDDECLALLAKAVETHDPESLDEVAWLIGRLAVPIE
jgi:hypothetical protein